MRIIPHRRFTVAWLAALLFAAWPAFGANPANEAVELPPVLVDEKRFPLQWLYVQVPGVELLTTCSRAVAREFMETYVRQEHLIRTLIPERYLATDIPISVLLIDAENAERLIDETMTKVLAEHTPRAVQRVGRTKVMPNIRLDDRDHSVVLSLRQRQFSSEVSFAFVSGRIAHLLDRLSPRPPPWLAAGLVGLYDQCIFGENVIQVSPLVWSTPDETDKLKRELEWPRDVLPLPALFALLPETAQRAEIRRWREQAALFVRWALVADDERRAAGFWRFADHCRERAPDEAIFRECFNMGYAEARDRISDYLPQATEETILLEREPLKRLPLIQPRRATDLESGRLRAEWARMEAAYVRRHHPDHYPMYLREARETVQRARTAAGPVPELRALSGLIAYAEEDWATAETELEAAVAGGSPRPLAAYTLARLRWDEYRRNNDNRPLDAAQTGFVLAPLQSALRARPILPEVYGLFADVWLNTLLKPTAEDLAIAREGAQRFPELAGVVARVALLLMREVSLEAGREIIDDSLARISEEPRRELFQAIRKELVTLGEMAAASPDAH